MKLAKCAVSYYVEVTGNDWSKFYENLDEAMNGILEEQTGELWLIHSLMNTIIDNGMSLLDFKANKDAVKAVFDNDGRKQNGEFFTPEIWAKAGRDLISKYLPNWDTEFYAWENSAGSGNLFRTANRDNSKLFMSTLQEDDVKMLQSLKEFKGAHIWQLDFLSSVNYDMFNMEFSEKLIPELRDVLENDKPLVIYNNPPYKVGMARSTEVGMYMANSAYTSEETYKRTGEHTFAKPAYDIFYQFCWQTMDLVDKYELSNTYFCFFGPLTYFTGASANILLQEFEHRFEFIDGMCISAQEFSDTSDSIIWGIGCSLWKARGGAQFEDGVNYHKDILLNKCFITPDGTIGTEGRILYEPPREKLSDWVKPKDVISYVDAPLMTSHLTFKGSEVFDKHAPKTGKLAINSLGCLMVGNTLTRSADQSAVLSMPTTIQYVDITEENFWRCVASFAFRRIANAGWSITKKDISAPNINVDGFGLWLRNALVLFLFEYKSMMSSLRDVEWCGQKYNIYNKLFYLTEQEIRDNCHDEVILRDLDDHPLQNEFMLKMIADSEKYWVPEIKALYDWCKAYTLVSYDYRKGVDYKGSLECADAGFQQLRSGLKCDEKFDADLTKLLVQARDYMRRDVSKFGFVSEIEATEGDL